MKQLATNTHKRWHFHHPGCGMTKTATATPKKRTKKMIRPHKRVLHEMFINEAFISCSAEYASPKYSAEMIGQRVKQYSSRTRQFVKRTLQHQCKPNSWVHNKITLVHVNLTKRNPLTSIHLMSKSSNVSALTTVPSSFASKLEGSRQVYQPLFSPGQFGRQTLWLPYGISRRGAATLPLWAQHILQPRPSCSVPSFSRGNGRPTMWSCQSSRTPLSASWLPNSGSWVRSLWNEG